MGSAVVRPEAQLPLFHFGVFELDVATGELRKNGQKIRLQEQPLQVPEWSAAWKAGPQ
jgi:hypothetical protein